LTTDSYENGIGQTGEKREVVELKLEDFYWKP